MSERLYYRNCYLREFTARVIASESEGAIAYLDRTAFYPTSGGQPFDTGTIAGVRVLEVVDEGAGIAHRLAAPLAEGPVQCAIDWDRRFDHMQQHTGQHLLSAVFEEAFGLRTISFHLGRESATIDLEGGAVDARSIQEAERRANAVVFENRPVTISFREAADAEGLRKPSEREGTLRVITIAGLDQSACGGTHVRATGEIGPILIGKLEKIRQSVRVEFFCGMRAVGRARADYDALAKTAGLFSAPMEQLPALVAAQLESARIAEKARHKLESELAIYQGKELYEATEPDSDGVRRLLRRLPRGSLDEMRALAQSFTAQPKAVFLGVLDDPPSFLYAVSADSGIDAGAAVKASLAASGGRGGGTGRLAQGAAADRAALDRIVASLT